MVHGAGIVCCAMHSLASADARPSAAAEFTSEYLYRQYSKSDGTPAARLNANLVGDRGYFGGAWLSNIKFGAARWELNPYIGRSFILDNSWSLKATFEGYLFDHEIFGRDADYGEAYVRLHYRDIFTARVGLAVAAYGSRHPVPNIEVTGRYQITDVCDLTGVVGYDRGSQALHYDAVYWRLKLTYYFGPHFALGMAYVGAEPVAENSATASDRFSGALLGNRAVVSISVGY